MRTATVIHDGMILKNEYLKNQCIQDEYDPCIKEKNEYFHNL